MTSTQVRETHRTPLSQALTGTCPDCKGNFETCRCTGGVAVLARCATTAPAPTAGGGYGGWEDDDNQRGYEHDETDQFNRLVQQLVDDGDERAAVAGRRARRTLQEMIPGYVRQPVLVLHRPAMADEACGLCHRWNCGGHDCPRVVALTEQERKDLSDKVRDANKRSESRPK
ncbi:hypothetical protein ACFWJY_18235 [Streptomyces anulatus]|uniref:hypothetical protein n=1 Tax=Streptomyces anulatus TaxID=1892 RepID=UPI0036660A02